MIAFEREGSVWVIGVDGANERMIGPGFEPAWSPDGHTIAFSSARGIEVMTLDGKGRRVLLSREDPFDGSSPWPLGLRKPAWAPDGSRIAFERDGDGDLVFSHVYVVNADGTAPRRVTIESDFFSQESDPVWSPDGLELVFWSLRHGVARAPASGGSPRPAYSDFPAVRYGARPAWSPGGGVILFGENVGSNVDAAVWAVSASGGQPRWVVRWATMPTWSPDGKRIAVVGVGVPLESPRDGPGRER
jgi:Tol biopolymer transport system component